MGNERNIFFFKSLVLRLSIQFIIYLFNLISYIGEYLLIHLIYYELMMAYQIVYEMYYSGLDYLHYLERFSTYFYRYSLKIQIYLRQQLGLVLLKCNQIQDQFKIVLQLFNRLSHNHLNQVSLLNTINLVINKVKLEQDNFPSIRGFNQYGLDLQTTQRDDTLKFRSTSQNGKNLQLRRQNGDISCLSHEKIRVFDIFNQSERLNKQPITSNTYITTKKSLKAQLQQQKYNETYFSLYGQQERYFFNIKINYYVYYLSIQE
ncbi:unnamed protein product (macronuclear) [Paramecium tetraurelia]|uniref:Transmembrane protein n=1 Tax=Paramecium tetraurelia TaxID=5888 RepID=A0CAT1_PARTE|nr:uncharacterized protein GSPATT00036679001 [Paramecium tetraurelia]CAK67898.1 unnamed protein product [Paramecium tetraurelia]|eukprot:XP_001435295.1 hypothetical protein (macronuclear) [Paramecium tetraurelia strain d4-2]